MTYDVQIKRSADFSSCRKYRYTLIREWDSDLPRCLFILLNPSTADEVQDDPTNRRGIRYAMDWGYGSVVFCNLFAYRSPYPKIMKQESDPVGPDNNRQIYIQHRLADITVAAWGNDGMHQDRDVNVKSLLGWENMHVLGLNKSGCPKHILYLKKDLIAMSWPNVIRGLL